MELLADGAVVARLNCKFGQALLFVPIKDDNETSYQVWETTINLWNRSVLSDDCRMICLVDPPEVGSLQQVADLGFASAATFCSNDRGHYANA